MSTLFAIAQILFWLVSGTLAVLVGYLVVLTIAAWWAEPQSNDGEATKNHRFVFLVPAHNEEELLPKLLASLHQVTYPAALYTVHVVADNCTDQTATIARQLGAVVHERTNRTLIGKGYALQWLLEQLWHRNERFDVAIILDADSVVSANFLDEMNLLFSRGAQAVQAHYAVLEPERSWMVSLRTMALAVLHYLRPLGRTQLGLSVGLKGNGMAFRRELLQTHQWSAAVTEDIEFHMALVLAGKKVWFAPKATVWAEMPALLANAQSQNMRWEQGRIEMAKRYVPQLLQVALQRQKKWQERTVLLDAAIEHLIPPFSVLLAMSMALLATALMTQAAPAIAVTLFLVIGQVLYLGVGLKLIKVSTAVYRHLLYVPFFMLWKIVLYSRALLGFDKQGWQRTGREQVGIAPHHPKNKRGELAPTKVDQALSLYSRDHVQEPLNRHHQLKLVLWSLRLQLLRRTKRLLDLIVAILAFLTLTPFMLIIAILIRLESPGPVIFRQVRVGRWGKPFTCYKFRSMYIDAEERKAELYDQNEVDGPVFKIHDDPRVTRIGKIIRKTSIDELPQLINVLKGDMSLVGPRPPVPYEVSQYELMHLRRLDTIPGLTGLQQVSGRSDLSFERWIELDLQYIAEQNLKNDLKILLKTIPTVIFGRGAY